MTAAPQRLRAAHVRRPHGVRGELRAEPLGGDPARFVPGLRLYAEGDAPAVYTVASARPAAEGDMLLALSEVTTRDAAERLRGAYLCVDRDAVRRLGDDEWFVFDLVGLRVVGEDGAELGTVADVEEYPEQSVLVVRRDAGAERRIPLVRAHVQRVDVTGGQIVVTPWPEDEA
jgi:16S rRNA processing protein RimM